MRLQLRVTDNQWSDYLRSRPRITEANFWVPGGREFHALTYGEPVLFKAKSPVNRLIGGGTYTDYFQLPVSEAWAIWDEGNGFATETEFHDAMLKARAGLGKAYEPDPTIGCLILSDLFFAPDGEELPLPEHYPASGPKEKTYRPADDNPDYDYVAHAYDALRTTPRIDVIWEPAAPRLMLDGPRYRPATVMRRLGQGAFKAAVERAYERRCAITGNKVLPALEAAHIVPFSQNGAHDVPNGLLLRADVHNLFDKGYLSVDVDYRFRVSPLIRTVFGNGDEFYQREGNVIRLPERPSEMPDRDALSWHHQTIFKSASRPKPPEEIGGLQAQNRRIRPSNLPIS